MQSYSELTVPINLPAITGVWTTPATGSLARAAQHRENGSSLAARASCMYFVRIDNNLAIQSFILLSYIYAF